MHSLFTLNLDLERAGKVICVQSLPFDTARETLLLLSPVGTQCCYMKNAALFLISHFNLIILESDTWLAYANEAGVNPEEGVADFIRQFNAALPEPVRVDALVGYCSSAPLALLAANQGACRTLLLLNGAYFLKDDGVIKSQYERDVERMMQSIPQGNCAQVYEAVSLLHTKSAYTPSDYRYQQVRPLRELSAFRQYLTFLNSLASLESVRIAKTVKTPTLVWCGSQDRYTDTASSRYIAQLLPHGELVEDPDGQHHDFVDGHERLYLTMTHFLTRHKQRAIQ
ncbi:coronamic acid synthetase CmaE [Pseudomonas coronafaciens pv. porri]|uniref:Coronamic acid synthetase CmaE n=1 Tax=Pseudomonas coronafaciens pv. porri TaxID=83964 RepID=A0ABR5JP28_9PSED|nr:alpha/beta fold hydrolase [Pseudomonas coronafaciens]KOP56746.1 coronamic acid synthetase CmaE [Pseudomonas coronafaciens pv. porri]KOP59229.1 coronamic acid synthetase CmaE [Pseudomonas coronafaciens pv. porri]KPY26513.1 Coronamic acid synthetase CmaE [Pseudomonas coronafaciens pv. porri]RMU80851.1 Coronamic acid synthetase CmaE [Pseudomonas coronafaciens pv. porri]RMV98324.1 Coronamic acid synthetase CmaE [Pseudomonas coronafaciens pv. porri]